MTCENPAILDRYGDLQWVQIMRAEAETNGKPGLQDDEVKAFTAKVNQHNSGYITGEEVQQQMTTSLQKAYSAVGQAAQTLIEAGWREEARDGESFEARAKRLGVEEVFADYTHAVHHENKLNQVYASEFSGDVVFDKEETGFRLFGTFDAVSVHQFHTLLKGGAFPTPSVLERYGDKQWVEVFRQAADTDGQNGLEEDEIDDFVESMAKQYPSLNWFVNERQVINKFMQIWGEAKIAAPDAATHTEVERQMLNIYTQEMDDVFDQEHFRYTFEALISTDNDIPVSEFKTLLRGCEIND